MVRPERPLVPVSHDPFPLASVDPIEVGLAAVAALLALFTQVADPRDARGIRHRLGSVLTVMVFAALAGAKTFREVGDRVGDLPPVLLEAAGTRRCPRSGVFVPPCADTIRRIVEDLDGQAVDLLVGRWITARAGRLRAEAGREDGAAPKVAMALDGKVVRNSGGGGADVKLFSAMLHDQAVVIAQLLIPDGTNEITCVKALLDPVAIGEVVVTADAAHAQTKTAEYLTGRDADYVLTVKGNRKALLTQVKAILGQAGLDDLDGVDGACHVADDAGHGRRVRRAIWLAPAGGVDFPGAEQVFRIRREVRNCSGQLVSKEIVHGVTSLSAEEAGAEAVARWVRAHWGIENKIHWVRDVVFGEDAHHAYLGAAAQVMAMFRNLAIGLIRLSGIVKISQTLERIAADRNRILPLLAASRP